MKEKLLDNVSVQIILYEQRFWQVCLAITSAMSLLNYNPCFIFRNQSTIAELQK